MLFQDRDRVRKNVAEPVIERKVEVSAVDTNSTFEHIDARVCIDERTNTLELRYEFVEPGPLILENVVTVQAIQKWALCGRRERA